MAARVDDVVMPESLNAPDSVLDQLERELPSEFPIETPRGLVYHYTDAAGLDGILKSGCIRATHFAHQNDPRELLEGEQLVREVAESMMGALPTQLQNGLLTDFLSGYEKMVMTNLVKDLYIASFSEHDDDLSQWRAYGGRGAGYAIGLTFNIADEAHNEAARSRGLGQTMAQVRYDREAMKLRVRADLAEVFGGLEKYFATFPNRAEELLNRGMVVAYRRAARIAPIFKHPKYSGEAEWRLIASVVQKDAEKRLLKTRPSVTGIVPFLDLPLEYGKDGPVEIERLVVGPSLDSARSVRAAQLMLRGLGYTEEQTKRVVVPSEIPFRG